MNIVTKLLAGLRWAIGIVLLMVALAFGTWGLATSDTGFSREDRPEWDEREESREKSRERDEDEDEYRPKALRSGSGIQTSELYQSECGSCHMAYPAQLLPEPSWKALMSSLENHFGEDASLAADVNQTLTEELVSGAADNVDTRLARRVMRRVNLQEPNSLRITELPFFRRIHHEVPKRLVSGNPEVGSFSNCNACHEKAERGLFDEHTVDIPGYGRFDD